MSTSPTQVHGGSGAGRSLPGMESPEDEPVRAENEAARLVSTGAPSIKSAPKWRNYFFSSVTWVGGLV